MVYCGFLSRLKYNSRDADFQQRNRWSSGYKCWGHWQKGTYEDNSIVWIFPLALYPQSSLSEVPEPRQTSFLQQNMQAVEGWMMWPECTSGYMLDRQTGGTHVLIHSELINKAATLVKYVFGWFLGWKREQLSCKTLQGGYYDLITTCPASFHWVPLTAKAYHCSPVICTLESLMGRI